MLSAIMFIVAGTMFALFAGTFERMVVVRSKLPLYQFSNAYYCLALALFAWGIASAFGNETYLSFSVVAGDALLLAATIFLASIIVPVRYYQDFWFISATLASFLIAARGILIPPQPYIQDGLLIFNTQKPVMMVLGLCLALIWLPVSLYVAKLVTHAIRQDSLNLVFTTIYSAATISAIVFISTRSRAVILASLAAIIVSFILLLSSNLLVAKLLRARTDGK